MSSLRDVVGYLKGLVLYVWRKPRYKRYYISDYIKKPLCMTPWCIELGEEVSIWYHARIQGIKKYNNLDYNPRIILHDRVSIQQNFHLTCANLVEIGEDSAIAANVTITDIHHPYWDVDIPIEKQNLEVKSVRIGKGCKIYNNVVVLPGTFIGNHVTVGANSVVCGEFPDNCVIVGSPAKIIKRYDNSNKEWRKTNEKGSFV